MKNICQPSIRHYLFLIFFCLGTMIFTPSYAAEDPLVTLRPGHPRLITLDSDLPALRDLIQKDPTAQELYQNLTIAADQLQGMPTVQFDTTKNMVKSARRILQRIYLLATLYRLETKPDKKSQYAQRAQKELIAAANLDTWDPNITFLSVAELMHTLAIGYDWFYPALSESDRNSLRQALIEKGLQPYVKEFGFIRPNGKPKPPASWTTSKGNWNQVCNNSGLLAALAIADQDPVLARKVISLAQESLPISLAVFAPDGGWPEGPTYWMYATRYLSYGLAGLKTALGNDFGYSNTPGLANTGNFRIHFTGPTHQVFDFSDSGANVGDTHALLWMAKQYNQPLYAWYQRTQFIQPFIQKLNKAKDHMWSILDDMNTPYVLNLVWYSPNGSEAELEKLPPSALYAGINVGFLRTSWKPEALFVGFKGGNTDFGHSHLDLGSLILEFQDKRWISDLGSDEYNLPGYFDVKNGKRWNYFRTSTVSHNILLLNGQNQSPTGQAKIIQFAPNDPKPQAVIDWLQAYPPDLQLVSATRTLTILDNSLRVQDAVQAKTALPATWNMLTSAEVKVTGNQAILTHPGNKSITITLVEPPGLAFSVAPAKPPANPPKQDPNTGFSQISATLPKAEKSIQFTVDFSGKSGL